MFSRMSLRKEKPFCGGGAGLRMPFGLELILRLCTDLRTGLMVVMMDDVSCGSGGEGARGGCSGGMCVAASEELASSCETEGSGLSWSDCWDEVEDGVFAEASADEAGGVEAWGADAIDEPNAPGTTGLSMSVGDSVDTWDGDGSETGVGAGGDEEDGSARVWMVVGGPKGLESVGADIVGEASEVLVVAQTSRA
jgi:hypothetical protein